VEIRRRCQIFGGAGAGCSGGEGAAQRTVRGGGNGCVDLGFQLILYYVITITAIVSKMDGQK